MKKAVSVLLSVFLVAAMGLTGCGSKKEVDTSGKANVSGGDSGSTASSGKKLTWDTADLSWKKDKSPVTFDTYLDFSWYEVDSWGNDDVSKEITKRTGVSLNPTKGTDSNQLQVLLAADELPEIIFTDHQVQRFYNSDIVYPFDELMKKSCPEFLDLIDPVEIANNTQDDGHFYTLYSDYVNDEDWKNEKALPSVGDPTLAVREDIMKELGNPPLESLEDLLKIYKMVKEKYPNMVVYLPHSQWPNPFMEFVGYSDSVPYVDKDGGVHLGWTEPGFVDYFKFLNELYRDGYVSPESFTYKNEQFKQIIQTGNVFSASYNTYVADSNNRFFDSKGMKAHFVPVMKALKYKGESRLHLTDASIGWANAFITKKCKNPERAIRYMEFLKSPEGDRLTQWGIEGQHYTLTPEGLVVQTDDYKNKTGQQTGVPYWAFMANGLTGNTEVYSRKISEPKYSVGVDVCKWRKQFYKREPALFFAWPKADTEEYTIYSKLQDIYNNSQMSIILAKSEQEVDEKYNKMIDDAKKSGMDKLEKYMTEAYKKALTKYSKTNK